jgi:hypothetical protein
VIQRDSIDAAFALDADFASSGAQQLPRDLVQGV